MPMWRSSFAITVGVAVIGVGTATYVLKQCRKRNLSKIIDMIEELQRPSVHVKNPDRVEEILNQLVSGGKDRLQVITDFDMTLSRFSFNGKKCPSCHGILDNSSVLPESYRKEAAELKNKYYAIEISSEMKEEDKHPYMIEWWTKSHKLLAKCNIYKNDITEMVQQSGAKLRDGCDVLFENLHQSGVPLLVFSAGVGDILEEVILQSGHSYDNMQVVANYIDFNEEDKLIGFKGDMIHTYNKNQSVLHDTDYFEKVENRNNVILLGDTLGDLSMADGVKNMQACLKIAFLNDKVDERLEQFKNNYDVVLVSDMTMDIPNAILRKIL